MVAEQLLREIAQAGVCAPSADNRHVFTLEFMDGAIHLWPTSEFATTTERHRRVLGWLSLGAVVENMRLRATALALACKVTWSALDPDAPVARIEFAPQAGLSGDELATSIEARHTNRRMYRGPQLTAEEQGALSQAAGSDQGVQLIWLQGDRRRSALGLIWRAESERFLRRRLHEELFDSIRFDLPWSASADWALPPGALEVEAPMRPAFKALRRWALMRPMTWIGGHRMLGLRAGWLPCWQAPALGVIAVPGTAESGAVPSGAAFERIWLRATQMGLALQPMAAAAVLALQSDEDEGASADLRQALKSGWQGIVGDATPLMVFRIGRANRPAVISGRPSLDRLMRVPGDLSSQSR